MKVTWSGKGKLFFLKILLPLLRGKLIKQSKAELETFKKLVETKGYDFKDHDQVSKRTSIKSANKIK